MKPVGYIVGGVAALALVGYFAFFRKGEPEADIEYRYAPVSKGEVVASFNADGVLEALTTVEVRSKAGGTVDRLLVEEGDVVQMGDTIAIIDPRDTRAIYEQAQADLTSAQARAQQARVNLEQQDEATQLAVQDAEIAVERARINLEVAQENAKTQPIRTDSSIRTAEAALRTAREELRRTTEVTIPQRERDAKGDLDRTKADLDAAEANSRRVENLVEQGFVARADLDAARSRLESARAAFNTAQQRMSSLERQNDVDLATAQARVSQAEASLAEARTGTSQNVIIQKNLEEARKNFEQAKLNLEEAKNARLNVQLRKSDIQSAEAGTVRSRVSLDNARVQLDSTTVTAPRSGVVTVKYIEEGTVIPPGTSTFAQGTAIVQVADVSQMFVEVNVDEGDIASVKMGQVVRITVEAYPGKQFEGTVTRVNPAAQNSQNLTAVPVRVAIKLEEGMQLLPGMNARCEFITLNKPDVLMAPNQAVRTDEETNEPYVLVKGADPKKPERRKIEVGARGSNGVEIVSGLEDGEEVVIAEINLAELRELEARMKAAEQGGGLAGGGGGGGPRGGGRR